MKLLRSFIRSRYPLAILAGLALAASFPNIGIAGLAWIAPGMILLSAIGKRGGQAFRIGYVAGVAHYMASLYWLLLIPVAWAPILGWAALSAFIALYPATWVWLCWKMFPAKLIGEGLGEAKLEDATKSQKTDSLSPPEREERAGERRIVSVNSPISARASQGEEDHGGVSLLKRYVPSGLRFQAWVEQFLSVPWASRMIWAISGAALWVALEMMIARFLGGFPWNLLGDSQFRLLPLIQIASFTGVYGVSFLLVWSSLSIVGAVMVIIRRPAMRSAWIGEIILPMLAVSVLYATGYQKLLRPEPKQPELKLALVQPSIPQTLIWDPKESYYRFEQLIQLSQKALTNKPDLLIWPEAAVPGLIRAYEDISGPIENLARTNKIWMIIGGDDFELHPNAKTLEDSDFFNSSFLISPEGRLAGNYRKRNLVIFGEYVPLTKWLPFLKFLTPITGGFTPGDRPVPFIMPDLKAKVSVLICYEDVFPHLVREYVSDDTDFLVNLTNNGWFGEGAAQWQHAAAALFRAVENGVPLVRCSNNGLTCWIDSCGRMRQVFHSDTHGIYGPGFMIARIPVLAPGEKRVPTYYRQHGDVFGWVCVAFVVLQIIKTRIRSRR
ncbi:MAG TPA: apolipoprotein N-acyltransferase [Verrucomicrobiae bacterium]|nr:apolipoprotein N-acyltransferase [Verrucomicrobiae bacterium]